MGLKVNSSASRIINGDPSHSRGESLVVKGVLLAIMWGTSSYFGEPEIGFVWIIYGLIAALIFLSLVLDLVIAFTQIVTTRSESNIKPSTKNYE